MDIASVYYFSIAAIAMIIGAFALIAIRKFVLPKSRWIAILLSSVVGVAAIWFAASSIGLAISVFFTLPILALAIAYAFAHDNPLATSSILKTLAVLSGLFTFITVFSPNTLASFVGLGVTGLLVYLGHISIETKSGAQDDE